MSAQETTGQGAPVAEVAAVGYGPAGREETVRANRRWWDAQAPAYHVEHGDFLGADKLVWGPEGLDEDEAHLLGDVAGRDVLEVGAGGASGSRWVAAHGGRAVAVDLSAGMLAQARGMATRRESPPAALVQADARHLAFSAYGAVPFVADPEGIMAEVARVLRPGGRWVFAATHPIRWAFPDDPGPAGLTATQSYFDRTPYVESAADGTVLYAEHHRTLGDRIRDIVGAGLALTDLVEPEWPDANDQIWGGWSPLRGRVIPGTAIFVCGKAGRAAQAVWLTR